MSDSIKFDKKHSNITDSQLQKVDPSKPSYYHWKLNTDPQNVLWLTFDKADSSTNTLSKEVLAEFKEILQNIKNDASVPALVIQSGKKSGFIAGADIHQFSQVKTYDEALTIIREGQTTFDLLESLSIPSIANINGFCLGGGLELVLACRYRIAVDQPKTKLGLPEVMLGIHPGWGGTIRLPRLIGAMKAMDLILTGRSVNARTAAKMGLVDAAVPLRVLELAIRSYLDKKPKKRQPKLIEKLSNTNLIRSLLGKYLQKQVANKVNRAHYPAPFAVIEHWITDGVDGEHVYINEAKSIAQLMMTETARNLVRVFFLQELLKSFNKKSESEFPDKNYEDNYEKDHGRNKDSDDFQTKSLLIHVVGAGVMGGDISAWCALKGFRVSVEDPNSNAIASMRKRAIELFKKQLKEPFLIQSACDRLIPDMSGFGIKNADIIIEAILEKKDLKQQLFLRLEKEAKPDALFVTNTSTIPLSELNEKLNRPERLIGLHFFNPVAKMPLVEVIFANHNNISKNKDNSEENLKRDLRIIQKSFIFAKRLDKLPLPVESSPGFLVNRILMPYLLESILMIEEGIPAKAIDEAAKGFGMPMGPLELLDTVGIDIALFATEILKTHFPEMTVPQLARRLVVEGRLGKKTAVGFYHYQNGKMIHEKTDPHYRIPADSIDRLILRMINESVACLREGVVKNADLLDAGMIFGAGFPPFRGGPMHYVSEQGSALILQRLNLLAQRYGNRFLPDVGWSQLN